MPIQGLTGKHRLPRLGKIHLGIKNWKTVKGKRVEYPSAVDYFVCPPEVQAVFGEQPKELRILIPVEDEDRWASQYYRCYSRSRGLICKGDGINAMRMVDMGTGALADKTTKKVVMKSMTCQGRECPEYGKQCHEVMNLQFLLPEVAGLGIWQIDTGSINSIKNINSASELIKGIYGKISMIPLILTVEPHTIQDPDSGKKRDVYVLNLRTNQTLLELLETSRAKRLTMGEEEEAELPISDDEAPELIMPQNQESAVTEEAIKEAATPKTTKKTAKKTAQKGSPEKQEVKSPDKPEMPKKLGFIDTQWFRESLKKIQEYKPDAWSDEKIINYLTQSFHVEGKTIEELVGKLGKEAAEHFTKKIEEALASIDSELGKETSHG